MAPSEAETTARAVARQHGNRPDALIEILHGVQAVLGWVPESAVPALADASTADVVVILSSTAPSEEADPRRLGGNAQFVVAAVRDAERDGNLPRDAGHRHAVGAVGGDVEVEQDVLGRGLGRPGSARDPDAIESLERQPAKRQPCADALGRLDHGPQLRPAHHALHLGELNTHLQRSCHARIVTYRAGVPDIDPLADEPFSYLTRADGTIVVRYRGAPVTLLRGRAADRFTTRVDGADPAAAQQLMARVTGNFKRGNER